MFADSASIRQQAVLWRLLFVFSWQEWRRYPLRFLTAVASVILGVALAFAVHLINQSALSEFSSAVRSVSGQADLSVQAAHGYLPESWYPRLAQAPHVAIASPILELQTQARLSSSVLDRAVQPKSLRILAVDPLIAVTISPDLAPRLADNIALASQAKLHRLPFLASDSLFLNAAAQASLGVKPGQIIKVQMAMHEVTLHIVGTIAAAGDPLGIMDIAAAQDHFALVGQISRVDIKLVPGITIPTFLDQLALPKSLIAISAEESTQKVAHVSRAYRVNLTVLALVALFTGTFLVFSILSLSVTKRQAQFALLGVLGLTAQERLKLVLYESLWIGLLGALGGLILGTLLAVSALHFLAGDLGGGYFTGVKPSLVWSFSTALIYGLLGVVAALAGGAWPALAAQRLQPAQALKGLGEQARPLARPWLGGLLLLCGVILSWLPVIVDIPLGAYLAIACVLIGGIVCIPQTLRLLLRLALSWPGFAGYLTRYTPSVLAFERLRRMPHTATVAIAGVVASLSLSVALTIMVASFRHSVIDWLDVVLPADLYVRLTRHDRQVEGLSFAQPIQQAFARIPDIQRLIGIRVAPLTLNAQRAPVSLIVRPLGSDPQHSLPLVGDPVAARTGSVSIFVSEAMVDLYHARPGTSLALPLQPGQPPIQAWVRGVWRDYARQQGAIVMDQADYSRLTADTTVNDVAIWLTPNTSLAPVQAALRQTVAAYGLDPNLLEFATPGEVRQATLRVFDRSFAVTYWLQAVAIGIGLLGTAASFSAQVLTRRKEFGLLIHLGLNRADIFALLTGEGIILSVIGVVLGLSLGIAISMILIYVVNPQSFHWTMDLQLPWLKLLGVCISLLVIGPLTTLLAGRAAMAHDVVRAVKEDW